MTQHSTNTISPKLQALEKKLHYFSQEWVDSNEGEILGSERLKSIKEFLDIYYANPILTYLKPASGFYDDMKKKINTLDITRDNVKLLNSHGIALSDWVDIENIINVKNNGDDLSLCREDLITRIKSTANDEGKKFCIELLFSANSKFQKLDFPWYHAVIDTIKAQQDEDIIRTSILEHLWINFKKNQINLEVLKTISPDTNSKYPLSTMLKYAIIHNSQNWIDFKIDEVNTDGTAKEAQDFLVGLNQTVKGHTGFFEYYWGMIQYHFYEMLDYFGFEYTYSSDEEAWKILNKFGVIESLLSVQPENPDDTNLAGESYDSDDNDPIRLPS